MGQPQQIYFQMRFWAVKIASGSMIVALFLASFAIAARAEAGYRFWNSFQWTNTWVITTANPQSTVVDRQVYGWRFAAIGATALPPRTGGDFARICADVPQEADRVRVAVVIDPGTSEAAGVPTGTCVVTRPDSSIQQALGAVKPLRISQGRVCAIGGYPATGCGEATNVSAEPNEDQVELQVTAPVGSTQWTPNPTPTTPAPVTESPGPMPPRHSANQGWRWVGAGILALVAAGAVAIWWRQRRR